MAGRIKVKDGEKLDDANIEAVMALREQEKPITIKEACERLCIASNGARLAKIFEDYKTRKAEDKKRRAANRGKPVADFEKQMIIESILDGDSISDISKRLYRSPAAIKRTVEEIGIPERSESYANVALLPDQCVKETFEVGELVWVSRTNAIGVVCWHELATTSEENVYNVYSFDRLQEDSEFFANCRAGDYGGEYGYHRASDLGGLDHLKKYGIVLSRTYQKHFPKSVKKALGLEK